MTKSKNKNKDKNTVYLSLDDLEKLYGIDKKIMKKIKKKQKKRRKKNKMRQKKDRTTQETNQYNLPQQMMNGISYKYAMPTQNTSLIDNREAQMIKEQIEALKKNNRLQIADVPENFVNNQSNKQILDELENVKFGMKKIRQDGAETFNYLFDTIGDFHQPINFRSPVEEEEEKQNKSRLSSLMYKYEQPEIEMTAMLSPNFYQQVEQPPDFNTEASDIMNDDESNVTYGNITARDDESGFDQPADDKSYAGTNSNRDDVSILTDENFNAESIAPPPEVVISAFVPPPQEDDEPRRTYNSRVNYLRKVHNRQPISRYFKKRWENV